MERWRLKQRISRAFVASLRSTCSISARKVTAAVHEPVSVSRRCNGGGGDAEMLLGLDRSLPPSPPPSRRRLLRRHHRGEIAAGLLLLPVDCGGCGRRESTKRARKVGGALRKAGGDVGDEGWKRRPAVVSAESPPYRCINQTKRGEVEGEEKNLAAKERSRGKKKKKKKLLSNGYGFTSSSLDDSDDVGDCFFTSDGEGGELLLPREGCSNRSMSSDSEFYYRTSRRRTGKKKPSSRCCRPQKAREDGVDAGGGRATSMSRRSSSSPHAEAAIRGEEDREEEGGVLGRAVEKQSSDPYSDFRSSMVDMIVEKQVVGARELEQLLCCYLVLNSPRYHSVILDVFSEICRTLFANRQDRDDLFSD